MRAIWASAVSNSSSGTVAMRSSKACEDLLLGRALDREDEGKAEALLVGVIELGEARELRRAQTIEAGARLLARRIRREPRARREIGMGADERKLAPLAMPRARLQRKRAMSASRSAKGRFCQRVLRHPGRMLGDIAEGRDENRAAAWH